MALKERLRKFMAPLLVIVLALTSLTVIAMAQTQKPSANAPPISQSDDRTMASADQKDVNGNGSDKSDNEAQDDVLFSSKAGITKESAIAAVQKAYPEYAVNRAELGDENGKLIYEIKATDKTGARIEVKVDAVNGQVLYVDNNSGEEKDTVENEKTDKEHKDAVDNEKADSHEKDAVENEQSNNQDQVTGADAEKADSAADNNNTEVED